MQIIVVFLWLTIELTDRRRQRAMAANLASELLGASATEKQGGGSVE
jgi:hypothetical protein